MYFTSNSFQYLSSYCVETSVASVPLDDEKTYQMLARGAAYRCYATQGEIEAFRERVNQLNDFSKDNDLPQVPCGDATH